MGTIGFIGLGNMGLPMARNLVAAGHVVRGFDTTAQALDEARPAGIVTCRSIADCVADTELAITTLPDGSIALDVLEGILAARGERALVVDCSTIDIADARRAHALADAAGGAYVDAPVSGGVGGAAAGTLTVMAGGTDAAIERAGEALAAMAGRVVRCGGAGAGQAAKLCNNLLLAISMIGTGEAFSLGEKLGLDPATLFDVLSTSTGACWPVNHYCPVPGVGPTSPADDAFRPGFPARLMLKDMRLTQSAADSVGQATPLGGRAAALYRAFVEAGNGERDFSAVIEHLAVAARETAPEGGAEPR